MTPLQRMIALERGWERFGERQASWVDLLQRYGLTPQPSMFGQRRIGANAFALFFRSAYWPKEINQRFEKGRGDG